VITRDEIERLQPSSLPDLLRGMPGISLSSNGGAGKATSVFLRGTESDHTLVLIDGVKVGSATSGGAALQDIPVEQVERIEIVRGPFSSLYGSEALGGVIQIFTRRPHAAFSPSFSAGVGSYDTQRVAAGIAGRGDRGWYSINAAHELTEGFDACRGFGAPFFAGCFTDEPDHDGYRNNSLSVQGGYRFNQAWDADARLLQAYGHNEYDGSFNNQSDIVQRVAGARLRYQPLETLTLTLNLGRSGDLSDNFKDDRFTGAFDSHRSSGSLQADIGVGKGLASVGFDWQRDEVDSTTPYIDSNTNQVVDQRLSRAAFGQWQQSFGAHSLQASVRRDDNDQFGGKTTGSALWGWDLTGALRVTASYGTAYKAPTFNELYYPYFGNPNLGPETSRSIELGLRGKHGWGGWSANAFENEVDDLIAYDPLLTDDAHPFGQPNNIDRALIRGVEATIDATLAAWNLRGSATWLDPRNDGNDLNRDNFLPRRARRSARIDADRDFGRFSLGASVYAAGERYDDPANTQRLGGYATTDLRFGFSLTPSWNLQLSANNVFDRQYETAAYYRQPGRNYFATVRYSPR